MREKLLKTGMGCFVFASGVGVANTLLLPYARAHFGYPVWGTWAAYAAALLLFCLAGRAVSVLEDEKAARLARVIAPTFIACLFAAHLLMGYLLEYTPAGDNFMLYNGSQMLAADGNFDRYTDFYLYLSRYSNQWGFMLMLTGFYKLLFALGVTQTFFPLALEHPVGLGPQLLGGGAIVLRVAGGELFHNGGGKARVAQSQHGAGGAAQAEAQLRLGGGHFQPQHVANLAEVGAAAAGVGGGVAGQKDQAGLPGAADRAHRLLADLHPARLVGQADHR